jgi:hypothetical protein
MIGKTQYDTEELRSEPRKHTILQRRRTRSTNLPKRSQ